MLNGLWTNYWELKINAMQAGTGVADDDLGAWAPAAPDLLAASNRFAAASTTTEEPQAEPGAACE